jgi:CDP-paratose 2-epimerase
MIDKSSVLITGGAGFIGTNLANQLCMKQEPVLLLDNLSREGSKKNLDWLTKKHGRLVTFIRGDIRDPQVALEAVESASCVYHFAAQVAVTRSMRDPLMDFDVNLRGTLNLLEALRQKKDTTSLIFASTNKVYGDLAGIPLVSNGTRWIPAGPPAYQDGIDEKYPLDFRSPYACSKGAADQYVADYARLFGLQTVVLRLSCVYGPHQWGTEDQGWVAHFINKAIRSECLNIFGDGFQTRDILFADDLVEALLLTKENIEPLTGKTFNLGGGPKNLISLIELIKLITQLHGGLKYRFAEVRPGDQRYYCSNTKTFSEITSWVPQTGKSDGVEKTYRWFCRQRGS